MSRQKFEKTFNTFTKGLMTEASELNFPEDFSLYEKNFLLHRDGGRDRRKGMELVYPLGMILTSGLYPIEFEDSLFPTAKEPSASFLTPPEDSLGVLALPPVVTRVDSVRYLEYEGEEESISITPLPPVVYRESSVRYLEYEVDDESITLDVLPPTIQRKVSAGYVSYQIPEESIGVQPLAPIVTRR